MKTAIVYYSAHHNNTKKLLDAIEKQGNVILIDAEKSPQTNLSKYDLIGFASGIYNQKFHESVLRFAEKNLPQNKKVFLIYTYGVKRKAYVYAITQVINSKSAEMLGVYCCPGFDTFGLFKFVGGIAKKRPNGEDIAEAVKFFEEVGEQKQLFYNNRRLSNGKNF